MGTERSALNQQVYLEDDSGLALIVVLGVVSLFTILSGMLISSSKIAGIISKVNSDRSKAKYAAESATAYTQWVVANYNFNNQLRDVEEEEEESWWADGREHKLELAGGMIARVKVFDVNRGWDISQLKNERSNMINRNQEEDEERAEYLEEFFAVFEDYTDKDDLLRHPTYGMEVDDYASMGMENFPRNGNLQIREEIYWLKNVEYLVPGLRNLSLDTALPDDLFQVIPPEGTRKNSRSSRNQRSFWSAELEWLAANLIGGLSTSERKIITECRNEGFVDELTIQECLGFDLHTKLRGIRGLSFNPRNTIVFTIDVTAAYPNGEISRRMISTIDLKNLPTQQGQSQVAKVRPLVYWQKIFY